MEFRLQTVSFNVYGYGGDDRFIVGTAQRAALLAAPMLLEGGNENDRVEIHDETGDLRPGLYRRWSNSRPDPRDARRHGR